MLRYLLLLSIALIMTGCGLQPEILAMREVTSPEGYKGRAFYRNGILASEELDASGNDGKIDLWRYYIKNRLVREDFDTTGNGSINMRKRYDDEGVLIEISTDTTGDGRLDRVVAVTPDRPRQQRPRRQSEPETTAQTERETTPAAEAEKPAGKRSVSANELFGNQQPEPAPVAQPEPETTQTPEPVTPQPEVVTPAPQPAPVDNTPAKIEPIPETDGSVIQRITVPNQGGYPTSNTGIVPGPVFKHPSEGLED